ncbi:MAG: NUDIX domain-containing protein [Treponema sp.]|nr:NUDIX domain-containing protein [Treponema sp.]
MFNFCPSCASKNITFNEGKVFRCPDCDFTFYQNVAAATGLIISVPDAESEKLVFLVRGNEPAAGKLDLPGGFVDAGEGVMEGLYRELQEELRWSPPVPRGESLINVFKLFASFSNVYEYKNIKYNTCDMYFYVSAPGLKPEDLHLEESEISSALFLRPNEVNFSDFAFPSTVKAVKKYFEMFSLKN